MKSNKHKALNEEIEDWLFKNYREFMYNCLDNLEKHDQDGKFYEISNLIIWGFPDDTLLDIIDPIYNSCFKISYSAFGRAWRSITK